MRKLVSLLVSIISIILGTLALLISNVGTANASVIQTYGHNDTWWDIHENITCGTCSDRAVRVGVELRRLSEGNLDINVCIEPIAAAGVARVSIDDESIIKDSSSTVASSSPNVIGGNNVTNCADLDPNYGVCGPTRSSNFLGHTDDGVRRSDGVLLSIFGNSLNSTMPCD
jgi:hypothetical protein